MPRCSLPSLGAAVVLLAGCAGSDRPVPQPDPTSVRETNQGEVIGFTGSHGSHVWLGIPYAQPPVGELRWRAPRPAEPWDGRREALVPGSVCPQYPSPIGGVEGDPDAMVGDEDCLTLAVYAPRRAPGDLPGPGERWPVMVWIHGGGNSVGHAGFYDGGRLAQDQETLVVLVQYRLGPLGWLRHASLRADATDPDEASGNFGTLDMIRALEWVRDNAAAFGGDPRNVTIFGESAGGRDVISLLAARRAAGLFHRAISQSGSVRTDSPSSAENFTDDPEPGSPRSSSEVLVRLLERDGLAADRAQARQVASEMSAPETAAYLRATPASELLAAWRDASPGGGFPNVFADGALLPADGILAAFGRPDGYNRVPVMLGTNRDENRLFLMFDPEYTRSWFGVLYRPRDMDRYLATADVLAGMWKVTGADAPAAALASNQDDVYVYRFDWDEQPSLLGNDFSKLMGAAHGMEIPFVFGTEPGGDFGRAVLSAENRPGREALSAAMMSYWTEFARTGNPGRGREGTLPEWQAWDAAEGGPKMMVLDTPRGSDGTRAASAPDALAPVGAGRAAAGLRMSTKTVSAETVLAALETDPRLPDAASRCAVLRQLYVRRDVSLRAYRERCPSGPREGASGN